MAWRAGGPAGDSGQDIAVDQSSNTYVTGYFTGTATFGSTTLTSNGTSDIFIVKYNNKGEVLWAHRAGGPLDDQGHSIALDEQGNIYITGYISGTATFGSQSLTSAGSSDIFIGKYNSNGEVQWVRSAGGTGGDQGTDVAVDKSGNPYVTGSFYSTVTFGSTSLTSRGSGDLHTDVFIAKYSSNGDVLWVQQAGGTNSDSGNSIAVDENGNAYVTGYYFGSADFGTTTLPRSGTRIDDQFIAKYSSTGEFVWARRGVRGYRYAIAVDESGNIYTTGENYLGGFNPDAIYVSKLDTNGEVQWSWVIGSMGRTNRGLDIAVDKSRNVYIVGTTSVSQLDYNLSSPGAPAGEWVRLNLVHYGGDDIFVAKFDNNGNLQWTQKAGGAGDDSGEGIAVDEHGMAYTTGYFSGTATFGTTILTSSGGNDVFVAKFK
ncbi:SBBP repeat-containing protein [Telluribacter humicola]